MKNISDLVKNYEVKKTKITNERQYILSLFEEEVNKAREKAGYKPLSSKALAVKLGHLSTEDLKVFHSQCKNANNFNKYFWWALKVDR